MKGALDFYGKRTVLVTGHTGFKGSWLSIWLNELGAQVIGYALDPYTDKDNYVLSHLSRRVIDIRGDVRDYDKLREVFRNYEPEVVFHLAAQSLVIEGFNNPKDTFDVNVGGTINLLENCRHSKSVRVVVNVTSDKCYENREWPWAYREIDRLGGVDPYSSSKACTELITRAYRSSFFTIESIKKNGQALSSVRAGNVIGGGDWRRDRLIPDCIRAIERNEPVSIRNPTSIRPWQHVLEPLGGYLLLGAKMFDDPEKFSGAWNFGPEPNPLLTVEKLVALLIGKYGKGSWIRKPPPNPFRETGHLSLDISKAKYVLGWNPCLSIEDAIVNTVDWYKSYMNRQDTYDLCKKQISEYVTKWSQDENN